MRPGSRPMLVLLPLLWLAVVVAVAGVTWWVIDSAGRDVLTSGETPLSAAGTTAGAEDRSGPDSRVRSGRTKSPDPTGSRSTGPAEPSTTPAPSTSSAPQTEEPPAPPRTQQPSAQPSSRQSSQPPEQRTQVRSWQGSAGSVTTACTGASISLESVTPSDGWSVEVDDRGPGRVRVELSTRGDDQRETRVEAECSGGVPRFDVDVDD